MESLFGQLLSQTHLQLRSTAISCPPTERLASPYVSVAEGLFNSSVEPVLVIQKTFSDNVALGVHYLQEFRWAQLEGVNEIRTRGDGSWRNGRNSFRFRKNGTAASRRIFAGSLKGYRQCEVDIMPLFTRLALASPNGGTGKSMETP